MFYVYALLDPRKPGKFVYRLTSGKKATFSYEPFYIGKGKGRRAYQHVAESIRAVTSNSYKHNKIRSILAEGFEVIVVKSQRTMNEDQAYAYEKELIGTIGRARGLITIGPLTNASDGGEKSNLGFKHSDEFKKSQSVRFKGRRVSKEQAAKISRAKKGVKFSEEHKQKISEAKRGQPVSDVWIISQFLARSKFTESDKRTWVEKQKATVANRTPAQKKAAASIKSTATAKVWASTSNKKRAARMAPAHSPEARAKAGAKTAVRMQTLSIVRCPYCDKKGQEYAMKRWHFDNCRYL
jgi:hypothetical protein